MTDVAAQTGAALDFVHPSSILTEATQEPEAWVSRQLHTLLSARKGWANPRRSVGALAVGVLVAGVLLLNRLSLPLGSGSSGEASTSSSPLAPDLTRPMPAFYRIGVPTEDEAQAKWRKTLAWRQDNGIDEILSGAPPADFEEILSKFPSFMHLSDREGNIVVIDQYGKVDLPGLTSLGVDSAQLLRHYMFQLEWLWSVAAPREEDLITLLMDISNVTFDQVTSEAVSLVKARVRVGCEHYPNRAARIVVLNTPPAMMACYRLVSPMLSEATKSKMMFLSADDLKKGALHQFIHPSHLPLEYGGTSQVPLGRSELDQRIKQHVRALEAAQAKPKPFWEGWGAPAPASAPVSAPAKASPPPPPDAPNQALDAIFDAWESALTHISSELRTRMDEVGAAVAALNDQVGGFVEEFAHCETDSPCVQLAQ